MRARRKAVTGAARARTPAAGRRIDARCPRRCALVSVELATPRTALFFGPSGARSLPGRSYGTSSSSTSASPTRSGSSACGLRICTFAKPIDPDRADPELVRWHDVVEVTLGDVHVPMTICPCCVIEGPPMPVGRLVRANLGRHDRAAERHPDRHDRSVDEIAIAVREHDQLPPPPADLIELLWHFREHGPARQGAGKHILILWRSAHGPPRSRAPPARSPSPRGTASGDPRSGHAARARGNAGAAAALDRCQTTARARPEYRHSNPRACRSDQR